MEAKKFEDLNKGDQIKADLYSRQNALNGKYKAGQLGLDNFAGIKDVFFLETLKMKADLADKMIVEAESQGKNTSDQKVMKELGEEINAIGTPLYRREIIMSAVFTSLYLIVVYGIAVGIWGLVFKKNFLGFSFYGVIVGLLIGLLFVSPLIVRRRTKEQIKDIAIYASQLWGNIGIIIGGVGLIAWVIKLIFFK